MPVAMIAIFYFILIRPQRKKDKLVKEMLSQLIVGDKIITIGGIHGKITSIKDDDLVLETGSASEKSYVKISRWAVREVVKPFEG
jgi:preprotein translocase subunit YajC